jgi:anti-sigma-K factor RskA
MNEQLEEQASLYVLGLLDPAERTAFEAKLESDEALRRHVDMLEETAAQWAHAAPLRQPPAYLEARIAEAVRALNTRSAPGSTTQSRSATPWFPWALAACLAIGCVILLADRMQTRKELAQLQQQDAASQMKIAMLTSQLASAPNATAVVVWDAEKQEGVLKVANVPQTAADRDYQLWIVDPQYGQPVDAGVFNVEGDGATEIRFKPKEKVTSADAFAVSLERKGGVPKAEGQMVLVGK